MTDENERSENAAGQRIDTHAHGNAPGGPQHGHESPDEQTSEAHVRRARFSLIWIIPIVVVAIAAWLGWQTLSRRGPEITISFQTADGITSGQTQVKEKAVALGTVQGVELSQDLKKVLIHVQMRAQAKPYLTDHAQFWVVRPRLSGASVSGLETLVSGAYIAIDPGTPGGQPKTSFEGLESPPGVRSDEPGRTYTLMTGSVGSISEGAPVFFRDVTVGEVLGYKIPKGGRGPIPISIFVREPYDHYLRQDTRFWNVSGVNFDFSHGGLHVEVESLQAVLSGGIAFGLPVRRRDKDAPEAADNAVFKLYNSRDDADSAGYRQRLHLVTYFSSSVKGLAVGNPVDMFGLQIGEVTDVSLKIDRQQGKARVRVAMELQPERVFPEDEAEQDSPVDTAQALINNGLRAETDSANLLTGSTMISFAFVPKAPPFKITFEDGAIVVPSKPGGLDGIMDSLSTVADKIASMPIEQIGDNVNNLLAHADSTLNGPQLKQAIADLSKTLRSVQALTAHADKGLTPLMQRLPEIADQLQQTVSNANSALAAYGGNSDFHHNLQQTLDQLSDTARSLRLMADFLRRHPSSLILGRGQP